MSNRLYRLLFIVALVICQFSLVLHELDFDQHAGGNECTICLAAHGLDHALPTCFIPPVLGIVSDSSDILPVYTPVSRTPARLVARSPPLFTLHA